MFQPFHTLQVAYNCTNQLFASFVFKISCFSTFFSTLFHCSSSTFTTTTAQLPFNNCKLHFKTVQIVISCTLKYALQERIGLARDQENLTICIGGQLQGRPDQDWRIDQEQRSLEEPCNFVRASSSAC